MLQSPLNKTASPQAHSYITLKKVFTIEKLNLTWNKETCFIKLPSAPPLQKKKKKKKLENFNPPYLAENRGRWKFKTLSLQ